MTTEILIMNRSAIAMATDSLVSIRRTNASGNQTHVKSYDGACKMVQVSSHIAAMFYDSPDFHGMPWEVILNQFARARSATLHDHVRDYAQDFFGFLEEISREWVHEDDYDRLVRQCLEPAWQNLSESWEKFKDERRFDSDQAVRQGGIQFVDGWINDRDDIISKRPGTTLSQGDLYSSRKLIDAGLQETVPGLWNSLHHANQRLLVEQCTRELQRIRKSEPDRTGLVFAGFGGSQLFPASCTFVVSGRLKGGVRYALARQTELSPAEPAIVLPAAQRDLIQAFMEGINPQMSERVDIVLGELSRQVSLPEAGQQQLLADARDQLKRLRAGNSQPVLSGVSYLSAFDLANLAHALVACSALRNRVSLQPDTIGGPFDVAFISRAEGFQWTQHATNRRRPKRPKAVQWEA